MKKSKFADLVVSALTTELSILDSLVNMSWNASGSELLLRIQPVNQKAWREIGTLVVERLRELATRVPFKARLQVLTQHDERNLVFGIRPIDTTSIKQNNQSNNRH